MADEEPRSTPTKLLRIVDRIKRHPYVLLMVLLCGIVSQLISVPDKLRDFRDGALRLFPETAEIITKRQRLGEACKVLSAKYNVKPCSVKPEWSKQIEDVSAVRLEGRGKADYRAWVFIYSKGSIKAEFELESYRTAFHLAVKDNEPYVLIYNQVANCVESVIAVDTLNSLKRIPLRYGKSKEVYSSSDVEDASPLSPIFECKKVGIASDGKDFVILTSIGRFILSPRPDFVEVSKRDASNTFYSADIASIVVDRSGKVSMDGSPSEETLKSPSGKMCAYLSTRRERVDVLSEREEDIRFGPDDPDNETTSEEDEKCPPGIMCLKPGRWNISLLNSGVCVTIDISGTAAAP